MKRLSSEVVQFFRDQSYTIVTTIDGGGFPHHSCKGIVKITRGGKVYLLDLYRSRTMANLKSNPRIGLAAVDEHNFRGYCLKGRAKIASRNELTPRILKAWERRMATRITRRLLKNVYGDSGHHRHPEAYLPYPEYMIIMEVEEMVDLTPKHIRKCPGQNDVGGRQKPWSVRVQVRRRSQGPESG